MLCAVRVGELRSRGIIGGSNCFDATGSMQTDAQGNGTGTFGSIAGSKEAAFGALTVDRITSVDNVEFVASFRVQ